MKAALGQIGMERVGEEDTLRALYLTDSWISLVSVPAGCDCYHSEKNVWVKEAFRD